MQRPDLSNPAAYEADPHEPKGEETFLCRRVPSFGGITSAAGGISTRGFMECSAEHPLTLSTENTVSPGAQAPAVPPPPLSLPLQTIQLQQEQTYYPIPIPDEVLDHVPTGSSVIEPDSYMDESGRTYHGYKEGKYFFPNDAPEQDRLDMQHAMCMMVLGGLACAPMSQPPKYVMDVATGTGIWAIQFGRQQSCFFISCAVARQKLTLAAQENPTSYVVGTDLSKIQPENAPANCEFLKEDSEEDWVFPNMPKFDYVHLRFVGMSFDDPQRVLRQAWDNLSPGGWIEYQDMIPEPLSYDGSHEGTAMQRWYNLFNQAMLSKGRNPTTPRQYKHWLQEIGCEHVKEVSFDIPNGPWPQDPKWKRIGYYLCSDLREGVRGASWQLFRSLGLVPEQIEDLVEQFKQQVGDPKYRLFYKMHIVYGQKPLSAA